MNGSHPWHLPLLMLIAGLVLVNCGVLLFLDDNQSSFSRFSMVVGTLASLVGWLLIAVRLFRKSTHQSSQ